MLLQGLEVVLVKTRFPENIGMISAAAQIEEVVEQLNVSISDISEQVENTSGALDHGGEAAQVRERIQPIGKRLAYVAHFIIKRRVKRLYEPELPLRGKEVGSSKNAPRKRVVIRAGVPLAHAFPKGAKRRKRRLKPVEHVLGQLAELFGVFLDSVVDGRLDVRDDEPVEIVKQPALNDFCCKRGAFRVSHAGTILGRKTELPLTLARFSELAEQGRAALDPNLLPLEAPYTDAPLHWLPASDASGATVLVPAQAVFLFCNLDEQALFIAGGSTGLASGNIMDEAVVAALTEIAERDAEATTPYSRTRCFMLRSRDQLIQPLLDDYAACGIRVQFQDLTTELGLPVYQCFVTGRDGTVARATGANLCGARAALAALTETPWPYSTAQNKPP